MLSESHTQGLENVKDFIIQSAFQQDEADNINNSLDNANIVNNPFDNADIRGNPFDVSSIFSN